MLTFAYDGSLNGDWVAHYAARFARNTEARQLRLVHILEGAPTAVLSERLERIAEECRILGVQLDIETYERGKASVATRLLDVIPQEPETLVVTGTRARARNMALFAGTVSARLFAADRFPVVAIRVVHPGVLGQPGRVMLPVIDPGVSARRVLPMLRLFGTDLVRLHVLWIRSLSQLRYRMLGASAGRRLSDEAWIAAAKLEDEIRAGLNVAACAYDAGVVVTEDWPKEVLLAAGKHKSGIICLAAADGGLPGRLAFGNATEHLLRNTPCDVALFRSTD